MNVSVLFLKVILKEVEIGNIESQVQKKGGKCRFLALIGDRQGKFGSRRTMDGKNRKYSNAVSTVTPPGTSILSLILSLLFRHKHFCLFLVEHFTSHIVQ